MDGWAYALVRVVGRRDRREQSCHVVLTDLHAPILDQKARNLQEDLVTGDQDTTEVDRGRRNPKVVVVEVQSFAFERRLEAAVDAGDRLGDGLDAQVCQNGLSAGS